MWGNREPADRDYLFHPHGEGINLSRPDFDLSLAALAKGLGADVVTRARVFGISRSNGSWDISFEQHGTPSEIEAAVVIDATGRAASIAKRFGAKPTAYDDLIGIVGRTTAGPSSRNSFLFIEALESGWWYSAGLADGTIVATFLTDSDLVDTSKTGRASTWRRQLAGVRYHRRAHRRPRRSHRSRHSFREDAAIGCHRRRRMARRRRCRDELRSSFVGGHLERTRMGKKGG